MVSYPLQSLDSLLSPFNPSAPFIGRMVDRGGPTKLLLFATVALFTGCEALHPALRCIADPLCRRLRAPNDLPRR